MFKKLSEKSKKKKDHNQSFDKQQLYSKYSSDFINVYSKIKNNKLKTKNN